MPRKHGIQSRARIPTPKGPSIPSGGAPFVLLGFGRGAAPARAFLRKLRGRRARARVSEKNEGGSGRHGSTGYEVEPGFQDPKGHPFRVGAPLSFCWVLEGAPRPRARF